MKKGIFSALGAVFMAAGFTAPACRSAQMAAIEHPPAALPILRGGVTPEQPKVASLKFTVTPRICLGPCLVTLKAVVTAPSQLCVTGVKWTTDREGCNGKGCGHEFPTECSERLFSMAKRYQPGHYWVGVDILSDDTKLPAQMELVVKPQGDEQ